MVFIGSFLKVIDNSGARVVECIRILGNKGTVARPGSLLVLSVKTVNPKKKIKKGEIFKGILVATKKSTLRSSGFNASFSQNCAVLVNNKGIPIGTRLLGPVMLEVRVQGFVKVVSMATLSI
jgi:large subunit ribosomal protein L14